MLSLFTKHYLSHKSSFEIVQFKVQNTKIIFKVQKKNIFFFQTFASKIIITSKKNYFHLLNISLTGHKKKFKKKFTFLLGERLTGKVCAPVFGTSPVSSLPRRPSSHRQNRGRLSL